MTFGRYPAVIQTVNPTVALKNGVIRMATDKWYSSTSAAAPRLLDQVAMRSGAIKGKGPGSEPGPIDSRSVKLSGEVDTLKQSEHAGKLAARAKGVKRVENHLKVRERK